MAFIWYIVDFVTTVLLWVCWPMLIIARTLWDNFITLVFWLACSWRKTTALPPVFNPVLLLPASQLAFNIRTRKVSY